MGFFKDCGCGCKGKKQQDKFVISIISALTFYVIANPMTFRFVRGILGSNIASPNGCPTACGLVVHSIVFMFVVWGMMNIKKEKPCACGSRNRARAVGTKVVVPPMSEAPSPKPKFKEPEIPKVDTGKVLESFEIGVDGGLFN